MRRTADGAKESSVSVTVKAPESLLKSIDECWRKRGMASRSQYIEEASEYYLTAIKCPKCEAINPRGASHCAICHEPIGDFASMKNSVVNLHKDIVKSVNTNRALLTTVSSLQKIAESKIQTQRNGEVTPMGAALQYLSSRVSYISNIIQNLDECLLPPHEISDRNGNILRARLELSAICDVVEDKHNDKTTSAAIHAQTTALILVDMLEDMAHDLQNLGVCYSEIIKD